MYFRDCRTLILRVYQMCDILVSDINRFVKHRCFIKIARIHTNFCSDTSDLSGPKLADIRSQKLHLDPCKKSVDPRGTSIR